MKIRLLFLSIIFCGGCLDQYITPAKLYREDQLSYEIQGSTEYQTMANQISAAIDYKNSIVRNYALQITNQYSDINEKVDTIWFNVRANWKYIPYPSINNCYNKASKSIQKGFIGNCSDFAILIAALLKAIGAEPRIVIAEGPEGGHAYCESYFKSGWLNLDWTSKTTGGPYFQADHEIFIYPDGSYQEFRY